MNCFKCKVSFDSKLLYRTKPRGKNNYEWICKDCMIAKKIPVPWHKDLNEIAKIIINKKKIKSVKQ